MMKKSIHKKTVFYVFVLLAIISILDVFIGEEDPNRYIAVLLQGVILVISSIYFFINYLKRTVSPLHNYLLVFILLLIIYGVFTPNINKLPILLYTLLYFYLAYFLSFKGFLELKHIQIFAIALFLTTVYNSYLGIFERADQLGDFFSKADNIGYTSLSLMLLFTLDIKRLKNIIFLSLSYVLVLLSFKRGAMIIGTIVYLITMWPIFTDKVKVKNRKKLFLILTSVFLLTVLVYFSYLYWDIISYRFVNDKSGGSSRDLFWSEIVNEWKDANLVNQIFGFGLFKVSDFLGNSYYGQAIYAHSDWYELLYDHGLIGITIYLLFLIKMIRLRKTVYVYANELYYSYLSLIVIWLLKSYFSGMYINKTTIITMLVLGYILGVTYRNKSYNKEKRIC